MAFKVLVGNYEVGSEDAINGVLQDFVLGPFSFLSFINKLVRGLSNLCIVFAGDANVAGENIPQDLQAFKMLDGFYH